MKDCIISDSFIIDISHVRVNYTEENQRFKETFWTKYTLPFDIHLNRDFKSKLGHYNSFRSIGLKKEYEVYYVFEGKFSKGKMTITDVNDEIITIQVDAGFETLPNFEKKLNELPFPQIQTNSIYDHANDVVKKKYPEVNYNFPKLIYSDYNADALEWKYFDGFINNRVPTSKGYLFPQNTVENDGMEVRNRNILYPLLYLLYCLKVGFDDAGFSLMGDILEDPLLKDRLIFSSGKYYTTGEQQYQKATIFSTDFFDNEIVVGKIFGRWTKKFIINAPGKYRIICSAYVDGDLGNSSITIKKNGTPIMIYGGGTFDKVIEIEITEAETSPEFTIDFYGIVKEDRFNSEGVNIGVATINLNPIRQNTADTSSIPFIFNSDIINLKKAVPDMMFGELVTTVKNWRNYELIFEGNRVFMNLIKIDKTKDPEDFRKYEVEKPKWSFTEKKSFLLKFPKVEGLALDNIYYDETGYSLNKTGNSEDTTEIPINGFCLPIDKVKGITTAKTFDQNELMLLQYNGLDKNGDNHASNPKGLHGKEIAELNKEWYMNRLTNKVFRWTFTILKSEIRKFNIRSEIFVYDQKHWIKSWVKNTVDEDNYSIEIETETY